MTHLHFADARAKAIDIAAYLDRLQRHGESGDVRHKAIQVAIGILADDRHDKARRILEALSDPTTEPLAHSPGQGAIGVWPEL